MYFVSNLNHATIAAKKFVMHEQRSVNAISCKITFLVLLCYFYGSFVIINCLIHYRADFLFFFSFIIACNCFGHTDECIYNEEVDEQNLAIDIFGEYEGGGVCQNCQHNTKGINCNECIDGYYRPYGKLLNDTDVCQPCDCNKFYSTGNCEEGSGQCECRPEFLPPYCDSCNDGYYDYPNCKPCDCHKNGTVGGICEVGGGQCPCKENYQGINCNECAPGYYNFPECLPCDCSEIGTLDNSTCDIVTGQCDCINSFGGRTCDRCAHGYHDYPTCTCKFLDIKFRILDFHEKILMLLLYIHI